MSDDDNFYDKQQRRERDDNYWAALNSGNYQSAIYYLSPELHDKFLHINVMTSEERKQLEEQIMTLHFKLVELLSSVNTSMFLKSARTEVLINLALWMLQKWFRFGQFRDVSPYTSYDRAQGEAALDGQQVALVRAILQEPLLFEIPKAELAEWVSRIKPSSPFGWGECQNIVESTKSYNFIFQSELEIWWKNMRDWYLHTSLGGFR